MKFQKNISQEMRQILRNEFQQYVKEVSMDEREYRELCEWVQSGHCPYYNGWDLATEAGVPMDFVNALRVVESEGSAILVYNDEPCFIMPEDSSDDTLKGNIPF